MVTNAVNTELTPEFLETLAKEERTELLDYLNNYPFIRWMISPDRPYAKDLERDSEGKIIVNVVKPHILENMDYFRKPALAFKKHGKYTNLRPNGNPNSPYMKWLRKEVLKCWYGCKRPSDGEWITGYHYFYLNYSPIERATANIKDTNAVNRVVDFPDIYDGDYIFFHYINQARYGGMYNEYKGGQHSALIAARGKGKMLPNSTIVYTPNGYKIWKDIHPGDYLYGDNGKPTKVLEEFNHKSKPIYKLTLKDGRIAYAGLEHLWTIKYGNKLLTVDTQWIIENGFGKRIIKGKCHKPIECRAFLPINKAIEIPYKKVSIDPYLLGLILGDGCLGYANSKGVLFSSTVKDQKIYESLLNTKIREYKDNNCFIEDTDIKNKLIELCLYKTKSDNKFIPDIYKYNSKEVRLEVLKGLMDTDGSAFSNGIEYISKSKQLAEDVLWLGRSLGIRGTLTSKFVKYKDEIKEYFRVRFITTKTIFKLPRKIEKIKQRNSNYLKNQENYVAITSIEYSHNEDAKCVIVDNDSHLFLMNDFIVTHNSFKVASMATRNFILGENKEVCEKVKSVVVASNTEYLRKDGTLNKILAMTDFLALNTQYPSSRLKSSNQEMHWIMGFKDTRNKDVALGTRNEIIGLSLNNDSDKARGKRSHLMIWEEFGMFPGFIDAWNTSRPNVEEGGYSFGQAIALGTGGTEGSDFSGALEMIYNPLGYNVYGVPNMFDKGTSGGSKSILFIGEYMNRKGCYDKNGNSDVIKAVLEEVKERVFIKYNSTDPSTIAQRIAEHPMSIQEAVMRRDGTLFPVADLTDHLNYIESNKIEWHRGHLVGELYQDPEGNISFRPTDDDPIRDFPLKDNRHKGALEIYELPKEVNGKVPSYRYVGGIDPIDDDHSTTVSLPSIFILDMFTDRIVAEYTGRPDFADDFYEICRRLAIFYNASLNYENDKKGLFTYFSNHHCTHLLCDTPDILRDVELVKSSMYGNKAHPYDQLVYTPKGLQKWEEIQIGDYLFDTKGGITKVIDIPFSNKTDIYRLTLKDGRTIEASSNHLWKVIDYNGLIKVKSTLELKENLTRNKGKYKESIYYIPKNEGVEFKKQEIPLNPYFLGLLLGDGTFSCITKTQVKFASCISDMKVYMNILGYKYKTWDDRHHNIYYDNIKEIIKSLGLIETRSKTKFIPDIYKYNSKEIRLELLRGLLDTDGYCDKNGNCNYSSISKQLAEDVLFLARSLGINGNILEQSNKYGPIYLVRFYTDIRLFNLPRKYQKQKITKTRAFKIGITNIEYIGQKQAKCVTVDSEDHCYLIGDFVTTHNSKGTNSGKQVNAYARRLIRDWLLMPVKQTKVELDEHGDEVEKITTVKNLQRLRGIALIKELIMWNPDINADRVSALGMLMIIRENNMKYLPGEGTSIGKKARKNYLGNDPFFTSNFANNSFW
jgi:hypothetical protein